LKPEGEQIDIAISEFKELIHHRSVAYKAFAGVRTVAFSPDNTFLASGSDDGTVKLWRFPQGEEVATIKHTDKVWFVLFSPKGNFLASGSEDGRAKIWDVRKGKLLVELRHNSGIWQVVFSPDERLLAFGAYQEVHIYDVVKRRKVESLFHNHWVNSVAFSPDGDFLVTGVEDGSLVVWKINREGREAKC